MGEFKTLTVESAKDLIKRESVVVVDIRDEQAYRAGHIVGAVHLNEENMQYFLATVDHTKTVICYCYHGFSSQSAAQFLVGRGFQNVYSLQGGYEGWKESCSKVSE